MWYWTTACASLDLDPFEVINENQKKLEARYGEKFKIERSEVRKDGDLWKIIFQNFVMLLQTWNPDISVNGRNVTQKLHI